MALYALRLKDGTTISFDPERTYDSTTIQTRVSDIVGHWYTDGDNWFMWYAIGSKSGDRSCKVAIGFVGEKWDSEELPVSVHHIVAEWWDLDIIDDCVQSDNWLEVREQFFSRMIGHNMNIPANSDKPNVSGILA